jgi:hypothetical protein
MVPALPGQSLCPGSVASMQRYAKIAKRVRFEIGVQC